MKKLSILFVSVLALGMSFVSCSKDDAEASVEGKWNYTSAVRIVDGNEVPLDDFINNEVGCAKNYIELKTAGVANFGKYNSDCKLTLETGSWSKKENTLTITRNGVSRSTDIVSVTDSTMRIVSDCCVGVIITYVKA